mmetsp:Transcript_19431/g.62290  ORF Transcript_19431/g.62290 Transcript_19431/m.62290 type:complete len:97 (-) Transcript_19431:1672-1962(-)
MSSSVSRHFQVLDPSTNTSECVSSLRRKELTIVTQSWETRDAEGLLAPPTSKKRKMLGLNQLLFSCRGPRTFASPRGCARERLTARAAATRSACVE